MILRASKADRFEHRRFDRGVAQVTNGEPIDRRVELRIEEEPAEICRDPDTDVRCRMIAITAVGAFRAAFRAWLGDPATHIADHLADALDHIETGLLSTSP